MVKLRIERFSIRHGHIIIRVQVGKGDQLGLFCFLEQRGSEHVRKVQKNWCMYKGEYVVRVDVYFSFESHDEGKWVMWEEGLGGWGESSRGY